MNLGFARIYAEWPWQVDFHHNGCPLQISVHTKRCFFAIRPFSGYAQGGDIRGMVDFHDYEKSCRWELKDEDPRIWARLGENRQLPRPICTTCLYDEEMCGLIACRCPHHVRFAVFPRHLWREHLRWRSHGRSRRCTRFRWKDAHDVA